MRRGRFAGLNGDGSAAAPLRLRELIAFDLCPPVSEDHAKIAAERSRALAVSIPYLAASHGLWAVTLLIVLAFSHPAGLFAAAPLAGVLALDIGLIRLLRRDAAPHR